MGLSIQTPPCGHGGPIYEQFVTGSVSPRAILGLSIPDVYLYAIPLRSLMVTTVLPHHESFWTQIEHLFSFLDSTKTSFETGSDLDAWEALKKAAREKIRSLIFRDYDVYRIELNQILMSVILSSLKRPEDRPLSVLDLVRHWFPTFSLYTVRGELIASDFRPVVEIPSVLNELSAADIYRVLVTDKKAIEEHERCSEEIWKAIAGQQKVLELYGISLDMLGSCFPKKSLAAVNAHIATIGPATEFSGAGAGAGAGTGAAPASAPMEEPDVPRSTIPPTVFLNASQLKTLLGRLVQEQREKEDLEDLSPYISVRRS